VLSSELVAFLTVALLGMLAVGAGVILISGKIARDTALDDAENSATRLATYVLQPLLPAALSGEPGQREALDRVVATRLTDGSLVLVIVWTADGEAIYSSSRGLEGERQPPSEELLRAINGEVASDIDDRPELGLAGDESGPWLEVYAPLAIDDRRLAFEAYFSTDVIDRDVAVLRGQIIPLAVGAVAVLQLVQVPIVVSLGRRIRRHESERTELVARHLAASDRERRMIAADVHDGPVQDLAGVSYALGALRPSLPETHRVTADRMITAVRTAVASLRRLMVDIYPPDLSGPGLSASLEDLAVPLRERGVTVHVSGGKLPEMSSAAAATLYRTAKEALANVVRHADADTVWISLQPDAVDHSPAVRLVVADDGVGLGAGRDTAVDPPTASIADPATVEETVRGNGHLGLRLVRDRVAEQGGTVRVENRAGGGTVLEAVVPLPR
jgi:two-component system NarL family sensor kinase